LFLWQVELWFYLPVFLNSLLLESQHIKKAKNRHDSALPIVLISFIISNSYGHEQGNSRGAVNRQQGVNKKGYKVVCSFDVCLGGNNEASCLRKSF
jgi:hypothetical protein